MNVNLHIERLVLNGFDLSPRERRVLETAVSTELTHLLTVKGVPAAWQRGGAAAEMPVDPIRLAADHEPGQMGQRIARSVYGGLGK